MLAKSILSIAACGLLISALLPTLHAAQEEDASAGKQAEKQFTVELDPETFDLAIAGNNVFVKFFAPWCGHCKRLQPLWEQVAEIMNVEDSKVIIAKVDCTKHQTLCGTHQVTGYPTLRLFKLGEEESVKFKGTRDLPAITDFINQELNTPADADLVEAVKREEVGENANLGKVVDLTEETFAKHVSSGNHFVKFFAPWCGHCQHLAPIWESLAKELVVEPTVTVSKIDCTQFRSICQDFEVKGYPTLLWIEDGKKIEKYSGSRDLSTLKTYVEKMVGVPLEKNGEKKATEQEAVKKENLGKVVDLTEDTFAKHVSSGNHFVKFFAPWCSHCQNLAPIWESLAKELVLEPTVTVSKIDCTQYRSICQDFEVKGYPTLLWIEDGKKIEKYSGSRDLSTLKAYVEKMVGVNGGEKATGEEATKKEEDAAEKEAAEAAAAKKLTAQQLSGEAEFDESIADGVAFIKFYAPWCGHCQKLQPTWEQLATETHQAHPSGVKIAKVDCTAPENKQVCIDQQVEGYPTLFLYKNGKRQNEYEGSRSLPELQAYLKKFLGHDEL